MHSRLFAARHSLKFLEKPQSSSFTNPHPNNPSQTNLYTNTRTHTHAHYKNLVYLRELKEGLPHLLFSSFFTRNRVCMLMCVCMRFMSCKKRRQIILKLLEFLPKNLQIFTSKYYLSRLILSKRQSPGVTVEAKATVPLQFYKWPLVAGSKTQSVPIDSHVKMAICIHLPLC